MRLQDNAGRLVLFIAIVVLSIVYLVRGFIKFGIVAGVLFSAIWLMLFLWQIRRLKKSDRS